MNLITTDENKEVCTAEVSELLGSANRKMLLAAAICIGVTTLFGGLYAHAAESNIFSGAAFVGMFTVAVTVAVIHRIKSKAQQDAQYSDIIRGEITDDSLRFTAADADEQFDRAEKSNKIVVFLLLFIGLLFGAFQPLIYPAALLAAAVFCIFANRKLAAMPATPMKRVSGLAKAFSNTLTVLLIALWFGTCCVMLIYFMMQTTANSRVETYNSMARSVYQSAVTYQEDTAASEPDTRLETVIIPPDETGEPGSFVYAMRNLYYSDSAKYWCAIICDEQGKPTDTYISMKELTPDMLTPQNRDEQRKTASSPFSRDNLIGYYHAEPKEETEKQTTNEVIRYE